MSPSVTLARSSEKQGKFLKFETFLHRSFASETNIDFLKETRFGIMFFFSLSIDISSVQSIYSSMLNSSSQTYARINCKIWNYYYEAIQVNVDESDYYTVRSESNINTYGYIYKDNFDPNNPFVHLHLKNDDCDKNQFKLFTHLESNTTNILVVTTFTQETIGAFSILVSGPKNVTLKRISK